LLTNKYKIMAATISQFRYFYAKNKLKIFIRDDVNYDRILQKTVELSKNPYYHLFFLYIII